MLSSIDACVFVSTTQAPKTVPSAASIRDKIIRSTLITVLHSQTTVKGMYSGTSLTFPPTRIPASATSSANLQQYHAESLELGLRLIPPSNSCRETKADSTTLQRCKRSYTYTITASCRSRPHDHLQMESVALPCWPTSLVKPFTWVAALV